MPNLKAARLNALPVTPAANMIYFISTGTSEAQIWITSSTGAAKKVSLTAAEIQTLIGQTPAAPSEGVTLSEDTW